MMRHPDWGSIRQRHNPMSHAFRSLVCSVLSEFGAAALDFKQEVDAREAFPGIEFPGRSRTPSIDILSCDVETGQPVAVLSCKWSMRHDRISDPTNECPIYKSAAGRHNISDLQFGVITAETGPARLEKVLEEHCVDCVVHLHTGVLDAMGLNDRTAELIDLTTLVRQTHEWD